MQWDARPNAGFAAPEVEPWLPVAATYPTVNVEREAAEPASMLAFTRALLALRRAEPALHAGAYSSIPSHHPDVFAYLRGAGGRELLVVLNFSSVPVQLELNAAAPHAEILLSTGMARQGAVDMGALALAADEGLVLALER